MVKKSKPKKLDLYVYDDNINEYTYVVNALTTMLSYSPIQAESCVMLIQKNGKYKVKSYNIEDEASAKIILETLISSKIKAELVSV
jgi:ATP-dependent Clp protease adapter protein ClpS